MCSDYLDAGAEHTIDELREQSNAEARESNEGTDENEPLDDDDEGDW